MRVQVSQLRLKTISIPDPYIVAGDSACVSGALAQCVGNKWQLEECPKSQQCFVLPSVKERGTVRTSILSSLSRLQTELNIL